MPCYEPAPNLAPTIHRMTAMLCELCGKIQEANPEILENSPEIMKWWERHRAHDEKIAAIREKVDSGGLESLTSEERGYYAVSLHDAPLLPCDPEYPNH